MGLFDRIRNLFKGKGWKSDEQLEEEEKKKRPVNPKNEEKPKEEQTKLEKPKQEEQKQEKAKEEPKPEKEKEKEEEKRVDKGVKEDLIKETLDNKEELEAIRELNPEYKPVGNGQPSEDIVRENINKTTYRGMYELGTQVFLEDIKEAIGISLANANVDLANEMADKIVEHADIFRNRFTTRCELTLDNGETMMFKGQGLLPQDLYEAVKDLGIEEGNDIQPTQFWRETVPRLESLLQGNRKLIGSIVPEQGANLSMNKTYKIDRITYKFAFG